MFINESFYAYDPPTGCHLEKLYNYQGSWKEVEKDGKNDAGAPETVLLLLLSLIVL